MNDHLLVLEHPVPVGAAIDAHRRRAWLACAEAIWSYAPLLIAAAALPPREAGECIDGSAGIGMRIQPPVAFGADAAPLAKQQGAAEQVGPDLHPVEALLVALGTDADQRGGLREQRQLNRHGRRESGFRAFGHNVAANVSQIGGVRQRKPPGASVSRVGCYTIINSVTAYPGSTACLMADFYRRVPGFCGPDLPFPQAQ